MYGIKGHLQRGSVWCFCYYELVKRLKHALRTEKEHLVEGKDPAQLIPIIGM